MFCSHTLCLQNARCAGATAEQTQTVTKKSPTIASIPGNCYFSVLFITKLHVVCTMHSVPSQTTKYFLRL